MNISFFSRFIAVAATLGASLACSSGSGSGGGFGAAAGAAGAGGAGGSGGNGATGGASGSGTGGSAGSGGTAGNGGSGGEAGSSGYCPSVNLGSALPNSYSGTTVGKPNLVTSPRLEWTDAGDDALLFTAPEAGTYRISMPSGHGGCGASIREFGPNQNGMGTIYDSSFCPSPGSSVEIDGVFAAIAPSTTTDVALGAGQEMLIWVSCAYWSNPLETPYQILIEKP